MRTESSIQSRPAAESAAPSRLSKARAAAGRAAAGHATAEESRFQGVLGKLMGALAAPQAAQAKAPAAARPEEKADKTPANDDMGDDRVACEQDDDETALAPEGREAPSADDAQTDQPAMETPAELPANALSSEPPLAEADLPEEGELPEELLVADAASPEPVQVVVSDQSESEAPVMPISGDVEAEENAGEPLPAVETADADGLAPETPEDAPVAVDAEATPEGAKDATDLPAADAVKKPESPAATSEVETTVEKTLPAESDEAAADAQVEGAPPEAPEEVSAARPDLADAKPVEAETADAKPAVVIETGDDEREEEIEPGSNIELENAEAAETDADLDALPEKAEAVEPKAPEVETDAEGAKAETEAPEKPSPEKPVRPTREESREGPEADSFETEQAADADPFDSTFGEADPVDFPEAVETRGPTEAPVRLEAQAARVAPEIPNVARPAASARAEGAGVEGVSAPRGGAMGRDAVQAPESANGAKLGESKLRAQPPQDSASPRAVARRQFELVRQVAKSMALRHGAKETEVRLALTPPNLGAMRLSLKLEDGMVTGRIVTESHATRHLLQNQLPELREALAQEGFSLGSFDISSEARQNPGSQGDRRQGDKLTGSALESRFRGGRSTPTETIRPGVRVQEGRVEGWM